MSDETSEATPASGHHCVALPDLVAAFVIFLGRTPDDPVQQMAYWDSRPFSELFAVIGGSAEFCNIQNILVDEGVLKAGTALSRSDLRDADLWLASHLPEHRTSPKVGWAELLLTAVTAPDLQNLGTPTFSAEALDVLRTIVDTRREAQATGLDLVSFDAVVFAREAPYKRFCGPSGINFEARIERHTPLPVMLPMFTEGLAAARRSGSLTLGAWLEDTQDAALAGLLTHWLFDEPTYRHNRAIADRELDGTAPDGLAYLDFLSTGDAANVSPHPLFCHQAYRTLNGNEWSGDKGAFRHFIEGGQARGLRTSVLFDPAFYLSQHPHAALQIASGKFASPIEHCVKVGLAAGYAFCPDFDRHFYLATHPDVVQAISEGNVPSAEWHYVFKGAREGRPPNPFFNPWYYVQRYPFVEQEMTRLGIGSSLEHFLLLGQARGWSVNPPLADRTIAPDDGRALFEKRGRRAYTEIMDGGITIPVAEAPRLSVLVPVSNQADLTAGFLRSAAFAVEILMARRGIESEIIVIDNGSRDHTDALLATLPTVRVIRRAAPFSFPAAVNAAAAIARGDILLVANNDIEFQPDAFDRVVGILDQEESVGLLGAKIVLPNETLQEVGASLDRMGNTEGFGRGSDVFRLRNDRRVDVDYVSGCFIAFRRSDFDALSGFEEAYSPGYYEDVDFALRMRRDLNKATIVDAGLSVTHYENASFAKGRPSTVNMAGALRNRQHLKMAHAATFRSKPSPSVAARAARARDVLYGGVRVLMITDRIPSRNLGSEAGRQEAILDSLAEMDVPFDILALTPDPWVDVYKDPRAEVFRGWMTGQSFDETLHRNAAGYSHLWISGTSILSRHAATIGWAKASFGLSVICDVGALTSREVFARMQFEKGISDEELLLTGLTDELAHPSDVDQWVAVNPADRTLIEQIGLGPVIELGHKPRARRMGSAERGFTDRHRILLMGEFRDPNSASMDALEWVLSDVWPRLVDADDTRLSIFGYIDPRVSKDLRQRFGDRIEIFDASDDAQLDDTLNTARVTIAPDRFSGCYPSGVIETVFAGVPSVMTDHVAARLGLATAPGLAVGRRDDGGKSFADWINRLFNDEKAWRAQLKKQRSASASVLGAENMNERVKSALTVSAKGL